MLDVLKKILFPLRIACLIVVFSCAKEASKEILTAKLKKGEKLVSILHTNKYFRKGHFGEEFVVEAQLRSLVTKPIKRILLDVQVFDKEGKVIAARRHGVSWKEDKRKEKLKKYGNLKMKGLLLPGESKVCEIVFYASQIEPESNREKRQRTINKKFRKPRTAFFVKKIPHSYSIKVYSAIQVGDLKER